MKQLIVYQSTMRIDILKKEADHFSAPLVIQKGTFALTSLPEGVLTADIDRLYANVEWGEPADDIKKAVRECAEEYSW